MVIVEPGSAKVSGKKATARVRFSQRADVEPMWQDVRAGILRNVSVGYRVHRFEEVTGKGENTLPVRNATDWEPPRKNPAPKAGWQAIESPAKPTDKRGKA